MRKIEPAVLLFNLFAKSGFRIILHQKLRFATLQKLNGFKGRFRAQKGKPISQFAAGKVADFTPLSEQNISRIESEFGLHNGNARVRFPP